MSLALSPGKKPPFSASQGVSALEEAGDACPVHAGFSSLRHAWNRRKTKLGFFSTFLLTLQYVGVL